MTILYSFLFCGLMCVIGQVILDNTKLTPGHVTSILVVVGAFLGMITWHHKTKNGNFESLYPLLSSCGLPLLPSYLRYSKQSATHMRGIL